MAKEKLCGIYCIENLTNGKKYVGQSNDIYARWYNHKYCLNNNRHDNDHLQKSWNKYGEDNFSFSILELCNEDIIDEREQYYIEILSTMTNQHGYNLISGGNQNKHLSEETKMKISKSNTGKRASDETRRRISIGRTGVMKGKDHPFYGRKLSSEHIELLRKCAKSRYGDRCYQARKVICINTQEVFTTIKEAAEKYKQYGVNAVNIGKCCKNKRRYCGRFEDDTPIQWAYYDETKEYLLKDNVDKYIGNIKPVAQYDKDMNLIAIYESAREAERQTGIGYKMISRVCKGDRPHTHGYIFKFISDYELD